MLVREVLDGHDSGNEIAVEAEIHDKALEQLKDCIRRTCNVTLLAKLYQNAELKRLAFAKLCEIAFDDIEDDEKNPNVLNTKAAALNEVLQITQTSKNKHLMTQKNRTRFLKGVK